MSALPAGVGLRRAGAADLPALEAIRAAAFAPVFAGFRAQLGAALYELAQAPSDRAQGALLAGLLAPDSGWELWLAEAGGAALGFVALRADPASAVGELGLNAVHPDHAGRGLGTALYAHALERLRAAGMRAAAVATGGDAAHAPARRAYAKAGFDAAIPGTWMCRLL
jgi:GNAT superfamily N-acetyltransferase